ncbi:hypothetical protein BDY24DRAFT_396385 [Mrakia frigida]|uniref:uncharacterized protein n=1 Tax=Mrakia frigida TaxID=29902 RepID=UPI003FCC24BA
MMERSVVSLLTRGGTRITMDMDVSFDSFVLSRRRFEETRADLLFSFVRSFFLLVFQSKPTNQNPNSYLPTLPTLPFSLSLSLFISTPDYLSFPFPSPSSFSSRYRSPTDIPPPSLLSLSLSPLLSSIRTPLSLLSLSFCSTITNTNFLGFALWPSLTSHLSFNISLFVSFRFVWFRFHWFRFFGVDLFFMCVSIS